MHTAITGIYVIRMKLDMCEHVKSHNCIYMGQNVNERNSEIFFSIKCVAKLIFNHEIIEEVL